MKFVTRGLVVFILSLGMLVVVGCGTDNETEGEKLAKTAGDPGAPNPKSTPLTAPTEAPPPTEDGRGKVMLQNQKNNATQGYPGQRK